MKRHCEECVFFKDVRSKKRSGKREIRYTCRSIGKKKKGKICRRFTALRICGTCSRFPCEKKTKAKDAPCKGYLPYYDFTKPNYQLIFTNILTDSFNIEQSLELSLEMLQKRMIAKGFEVPIAKAKFSKYVEKIVTLQALGKLVDCLGLSLYKELILKEEIEKLFKQPFKPTTLEIHK